MVTCQPNSVNQFYNIHLIFLFVAFGDMSVTENLFGYELMIKNGMRWLPFTIFILSSPFEGIGLAFLLYLVLHE